MKERSIKILAYSGILLVTLIWGSTFVVMKNSIAVIPPSYLMAYRFTIAVAGLFLIFHKKLKSMTRSDFKSGAVLGLILFTAFYFQTYGLKYTTASKNAFITTLYVIIVPFLHWLLNGMRPGRKNIAAAVIALAGLALLSLKGNLTINLGDFLTLISGFGYAFQMIFVDRYTARHDPIKLTTVQLFVCAVLSWVMALLFEGPCRPEVFADTGVLVSVLYLAFICSMLCFLLQTASQKHLEPGTAAILLSFESVTGLIFSVIFLKDTITARMTAGCVLMFAAAILSEYTPGRKRRAASAAAQKADRKELELE